MASNTKDKYSKHEINLILTAIDVCRNVITLCDGWLKDGHGTLVPEQIHAMRTEAFQDMLAIQLAAFDND